MKKSIIVTAVLVVTSLGVSTAEAGLLGDLWELEKRKNAWLVRTFLGGGRSHRPSHCYHCYPQYDPSSYGYYNSQVRYGGHQVRYDVTPTCAEPVVRDVTNSR